MGILENIKLAISNLLANKLRSILTMLGIIIGISSVITIVTIGDSLASSITSEMSGVGGRNINVFLNQKKSHEENLNFNEVDTEDNNNLDNNSENIDTTFDSVYKEATEKDNITDEMIAEYKETLGNIVQEVAVSENIGSNSIVNGKNKVGVIIHGVNNGYFKVENIKLLTGRFIHDKDLKNHRNIVVVSDTFIDNYFGKQNNYGEALGESFEITIGKNIVRVYICGIYEANKSNAQVQKKEEIDGVSTNIYIPISVAKKVNNLKAGYDSLTILPSNDVDVESVVEKTNLFFEQKYKNNESFVPEAFSVESMLKATNKIINSVKLAISAVAAISLLVGGIGVMNIMMVSITERTKEIGIRKALGASRKTILIQFVIEAIIICVIGGIIGITIGLGLGAIAAKIMGQALKVNLSSIIGAVIFSMSIGVFFGYYPASKAAKLNPIDALRYE